MWRVRAVTEYLLDALATWRLVRLISRDDITEPVRSAFIDWTLRTDHRKLRTLIQCPHCLSIHCAAFVLALRWVPQGRKLRDLLAVSGAVSAFSEMEPALSETEH